MSNKVFADHELQEDSVIRKFRITASDGKTYQTQHYNPSGIIDVSYYYKGCTTFKTEEL